MRKDRTRHRRSAWSSSGSEAFMAHRLGQASPRTKGAKDDRPERGEEHEPDRALDRSTKSPVCASSTDEVAWCGVIDGRVVGSKRRARTDGIDGVQPFLNRRTLSSRSHTKAEHQSPFVRPQDAPLTPTWTIAMTESKKYHPGTPRLMRPPALEGVHE